jgi:putative hydrolase of the HAD superfamily
MNLADFTVVIFDLDNTLYNETDYLFPAYNAIANYAAAKDGVNVNDAEFFLVSTFQKDGRNKLLDRFVSTFNLKKSGLDDFLRIMRTHNPGNKIKLFPPVKKILEVCIQKQIDIAVVTNGNPEQQWNKVGCIDWEGHFTQLTFVFADEIERKPSPKPILFVLEKFNARPEQTLFIGDDLVDEAASKAAGTSFLHVKDLDLLII